MDQDSRGATVTTRSGWCGCQGERQEARQGLESLLAPGNLRRDPQDVRQEERNPARTHGHPLVRAGGSTVRQTGFESLHFSKPWFRWQSEAVHVFSLREDGKMVMLPPLPVSREAWNQNPLGSVRQAGLELKAQN